MRTLKFLYEIDQNVHEVKKVYHVMDQKVYVMKNFPRFLYGVLQNSLNIFRKKVY